MQIDALSHFVGKLRLLLQPEPTDPMPTLVAGLGCALAISLCGLGAAYATTHAFSFALRHQDKDLIVMVPVNQAGILSVYGIIIAYLIQSKMDSKNLTIVVAYKFFTAGLTVGLACLASGFGMGKFLKQCNEDELCFVRKEKSSSKRFWFKRCVLALACLSVGIACFLSGFGFGMGQYLSECNAGELFCVYKGKSESKQGSAPKKFPVTVFVRSLIHLQVIGLGGMSIALFMVA